MTQTVKAAKAAKQAKKKPASGDRSAPVATAESGQQPRPTREFTMRGVSYTARMPKVAHYQAAMNAMQGIDLAGGGGDAGLAGTDVLLALLRQMTGPEQWAAISARLEDWDDELDTVDMLRSTNELFEHFTPMLKDRMKAMGLRVPEDGNRQQRRAVAKGQ